MSFIIFNVNSNKTIFVSVITPHLAIGSYSQAIAANGMLYVSGCLGLDPETKTMVPGGIAEQTEQALKNLKNIIEAGGSDLTKVVKCTILLADMSYFGEVIHFMPSQFQLVKLKSY